MGREGNCLKGWGLKAMKSEFTQIFIDLSGLKVGWGETCLKGWDLFLSLHFGTCLMKLRSSTRREAPSS